MSDWNPSLYLKFEKQRTQPSIDLISRIEKQNPASIIDIGCGPGNSTKELKRNWPTAQVIGLDSSPNMIEKAKQQMPDLEWVLADAGADLNYLGKFDIVFSNAALQWIPDHDNLLPRLFSLLNENGVLAVQIPNVSDMDINIAVHNIVKDVKWQKYLSSCKEDLFYHTPDYYYDILSHLTKEIYLWETYYYHTMVSHSQIIEWYSSTGMRPILDKLPSEALKNEFLSEVLTEIQKKYKVQKDGSVLFPFRRIFFTAYKV